jgi:hypothetical protein
LTAHPDVEHRVVAGDIDCLDRRAARGHMHITAAQRDRELRVRVRVDDHIDPDAVTGDRRSSRSGFRLQSSASVDADDHHATWNVLADGSDNGFGPAARGRILEQFQDGGPLSEAHRPEEVVSLVSPVPPSVIEEPAVVSQRFDHLRWKMERLSRFAAHKHSLSGRRLSLPPT